MRAAVIRLNPAGSSSRRQPRPIRHDANALNGFALIEAMVTIVLLTIGLIGLAALQARTSLMAMESYQRTQALILAQDMAERIAANKANAARYVGDDYGMGDAAGCGGSNGFQFDLCTWSNAIRGAAEKSGTISVGTLLGGRGCIAATAANQYQVIIAWQGLAPSVAPAVQCGDGSYGADAFRRAVALPVHLADLAGV